MSFTLRRSDVLDELRQIPDNTYHGGLSDFPYGLTPILKRFGKPGSKPPHTDQGVQGVFGRIARGFLGQTWDELPSIVVCREMLRVFRPGACLLGFAHPRTYHRLAFTLESAGWVILSPIIWVNAKGFPKSHNISKALDKMLHGVPRVVGHKKQSGAKFKLFQKHLDNGGFNDPHRNGYEIVLPATPEAQMWDGYGTGLRGAFEPIVLAMKPLQGTYAANALKWGVAGLNLGACRVPCSDKPQFPSGTYANRGLYGVGAVRAGDPNPDSRWPANLILGDVDAFLGYETLFLRCPRALPWERNAGLDDHENDHPCVKPLGLCRYLALMILPPPQNTPRRLLVPYAGTGSEIIGAMLAGWDDVLGIERETSYVATARKRVRFWRRWGGELPVPTCLSGQSAQDNILAQEYVPAFDASVTSKSSAEPVTRPTSIAATEHRFNDCRFHVQHGDRHHLAVARTPKGAALWVAKQYLQNQTGHYYRIVQVNVGGEDLYFWIETLFEELGYEIAS